ncbi:MAG: hypothetical protein OEZ54_09870 [Gemmatimonadota bacterium]|nr:hypothetical protein [Gemmatimonadota bacterium]
MNTFSHENDPELAKALTNALEPADHRGFVNRVMAAADQLLGASRTSFWEILSDWAKPGLAAAVLAGVIAVAVAVLASRQMPQSQATIDDALQRDVLAPEGSLLMESLNPPTVDIVLAVSVER